MNGQNLSMSTSGFWDKLERTIAERDQADQELERANVTIVEMGKVIERLQEEKRDLVEEILSLRQHRDDGILY